VSQVSKKLPEISGKVRINFGKFKEIFGRKFSNSQP